MNQKARFLPKNRITKRSDFLKVQKNGRPLFGPGFIVKVFDKNEGEKRLGIVVTKKTGNAVVRARWKRLVRECFRHNIALVPEQTDVVFVVKATTQGPPPKTLALEMKKILTKIKRP